MIRPPANDDEALETVELGARMHAESEFSFMPYDSMKVLHTLRNLASQGRLCLLRYEDSDGKLIGFFCGKVDKYFFNEERIASDLAFYVVPERRGNGIAVLKMIRMFERWAKGKGAIETCLGISTGVNIKTTADMLTRFGYKNVGGTFKRRLV